MNIKLNFSGYKFFWIIEKSNMRYKKINKKNLTAIFKIRAIIAKLIRYQ